MLFLDGCDRSLPLLLRHKRVKLEDRLLPGSVWREHLNYVYGSTRNFLCYDGMIHGESSDSWGSYCDPGTVLGLHIHDLV